MPDRLVALCEEASDAYVAVALERDRGTGLVVASGEEDDGSTLVEDSELETGEGRLRLEAGAEHLELELAAQTSQLGFETSDGATIGVQAVSARVRPSRGEGFDARGVSWAIGGERAATGLIKTAWFLAPGGGVFILFATRPVGADDHGADSVGAAQIAPDGEVQSWTEPLLSTEYGPDGAQRRATLELWGEDDDRPLDRGAGVRVAGASASLGPARIEAARFDWKLNGAPGIGGYEILGS